MAAKMKCWECKEFIESKDDLVIQKVNNVNRKFHKGLNCYSKFMKVIEDKKRLDEEKAKINEGWNELYEYVKRDVLGYSGCMQLSSHTRNSLQRLRNGGIIRVNGKITNNGYPYKIILLTFKVKKNDIDRSIESKHFDSEIQKINYIMAIIKNSINDVYIRYMEREKRDAMISKQKEIEFKSSNKVEYIKKSEVNNKNDLFNDIW